MYMGAIVQGLFVQAPSRIATLLSRRRTARTRAIPVWIPRIGKKAMKTPSPKAAATRDGLSSTWRRICPARRSHRMSARLG